MPKLTPLRLIEDEPIPDHKRDQLQMRGFAQTVAEVAVGTPGPFTIGVFGEWGTGKTSLLRQARSLIDERDQKNVVTVWFNAWQYEKEEHLIVPLLATIVREIERKSSKLTGRIKKWSDDSIAALQGIAYGVSIAGVFSAKNAIDRKEQLKRRGEFLGQSSFYFDAFEKFEQLARVHGKKPPDRQPRIVVLVDDLDRCMPENAVRLLEGIKLVLAQPGFVFVLAVNQGIINDYLTKRYKDYGIKDEQTGKSYLDKIVQLRLPLPPHERRFEKYIDELLKRKDLKLDEETRKTLRNLKNALAIGCDYNPRTLVRTINNLLVDRRIYSLLPQAGEQDISRVLAMCAVSRILQENMRSLRLYRAFVRDPKLCQRIADNRGEDIRSRFPAKEEAAREIEGEKVPDSSEAILADLVRNYFLVDLLDTAPGRLWLTNHTLRAEVDDFIAEQRAESPEMSQSQLEIVNQAIRNSLDIPEGRPITDEERRKVTGLHLSVSDITNDGLAHLAGLENLQWLDLMNTQVGDAGLAQLARLKNLQWLNLSDTQVGDAGLAHLTGLKNLQRLHLINTQVTDAGVAKLKEDLPNCDIIH